jgi:predicted lipid-binding transport protein (Tim44 family)
MRHTTIQSSLALLIALAPLASCSKPPATPELQKAAAAISPAPSTPALTTPAPEPTPSTIDSSIATNVGDPANFHQVMTALQLAVEKHDTATIASLVSYPIVINPHTKEALHIGTPQAFIAQYDSIVTPHIAEVIAKQKYDNLFVNYQGAMFGNGELWIAGICRDKTCTQSDIKIRTIQNTDGKSN